MHEPAQAHPIPIRALWENFWVFAVYGFVIAIVLATMASLEFDIGRIQTVMMEPFSIYSFSILSVVGLLALCIANITVAKTGAQMRASWWVRHVWVPIANTGLSTGAIVVGMLSGLSVGMLGFSFFEPQALQLSKLLGAVAFYLLALLYPLTWMKRSLFDESEKEKKVSTYAGILYCVFLAIVFWLVDKTVFLKFIAIMTSASIAFTLFYWLLRKRNG